MTLSPMARREDAHRVLLTMFEALGDRHRTAEIVHLDRDALVSEAFRTTFPALKDRGLVERAPGPGYSLTLEGWLHVVATLATPTLLEEYHRRRVTLIRTMKRQIDGRRQPGICSTNELATLARLPSAWVWHALKSGWFELQDGQDRHRFDWTTQGDVVIPVGFGQPAPL